MLDGSIDVVDAPPPVSRTITDLEAVIQRGMVTFIEVGNALAEIRDRRLYKDQGFSSFEDYCQERWGWSRVRAHQYIGAAEVAGVLTGVNAPRNEKQARELLGLTPDQVNEVGDRVDFATCTAADVKAAVAEVLADELTPEEGSRS